MSRPADWDVLIVSWFFSLEQVSVIFLMVAMKDALTRSLWKFKGETFQVRVGWEDYRDKIVDYGMVKIYALASVQETKQSWSEEDDFQLEKPKLDVQVRQSASRLRLHDLLHLWLTRHPIC